MATALDSLIPIGDGHTELSEEDRRGLIPTHIATRGDLFEAEERNIAKALLRRRAPRPDRLLDDMYLRDLHSAIFRDVWKWAGHYRLTETNIGVDPSQIATQVLLLVRDARAWIANQVYEPDELAVRFHHRLVAIHPFPNGNGRHGRFAADYLVRGLDGAAFSWGAGRYDDTAELRAAYQHGLQQADGGTIAELLEFARA